MDVLAAQVRAFIEANRAYGKIGMSDGLISVRIDDLCTLVIIAAAVGLFFVIGLWCLALIPAYFLGAFSFGMSPEVHRAARLDGSSE